MFSELVASYIANQKFNAALQILEAVICQSDEWRNVLNYITKVKCLLETHKECEAKKVVVRIQMMLKSDRGLNELKSSSEDLVSGLKDLIQAFIDRKCFETSLKLINVLYDVVKCYCEDDTQKLSDFEQIAAFVEKLVRETSAHCSRGKSKRPQILMEAILRELMAIKDVDVKEKGIRVAWVHKYFAFCCDEVCNFPRSVELNRQGITVMKTVFGNEAEKRKLLGHLYNNMAASLVSMHLKCRARRAYKKAIKVYTTAEDWDSQENKYKIMQFSRKCLNKLNSKSSSGACY